jgi:four helix bundle protein
MAQLNSYKDLIVWQKAMDLAESVYGLVSSFPRAEEYRMTSQLTRAAVSIAANIAEGKARNTRKDYAHFLSIAQGSLGETETFVLLAIRLKFITESEAAPALALADEVGRMLTTLRRQLSPKDKR